MLNRLNNTLIYTFFILFSASANGDSFKYNSFNNHGSVGLINTPTARFFNEAVHGITIYDGTPDQKITLTSNPYDWLEAFFFIPMFRVFHILVMNIKIIKIKVLT